MDPLSVVGTVASLTATCVQVAKGLHDLKNSFDSAHITIAAMCTEASIISASLSRIQGSMLTDSEGFSRKMQETDLTSTLDAALTGCYVVFDVLQGEIVKLSGPGGEQPTKMGLGARAKVVWNEKTMQELLTQLRGLETALSLLLQLLATDTMSDLARMMEANGTVLAKMVERTRQIRRSGQTRDDESIFDMSFTTLSIRTDDGTSIMSSTAFRFDDDVINSTAYRRAMARAYAAVPEESDDATIVDGSGPASQSSPDLLRRLSGTSSNTAVEATAISLQLNRRQSGILPWQIPIDNESVEALINRSSIYTFNTNPDWATKYRLRRDGIMEAPKSQLERQNLIHETVSSEQTYLGQLLILKHLYKDRLLLSWNFFRLFHTDEVFPGAEKIFELNKTLMLEPLLERQQSQGPWIVGIGDLCVNWITNASPLYVMYAKSYTTLHDAIAAQERSNPMFSQWLQQGSLHPLSNGLEWSVFMRAPLKRLARMSLLLQALTKLDPPPSELKMLQRATTLVSQADVMCTTIISNERRRAMEVAINSRIADRHYIPDDVELEFHRELKLKKTFDSSAVELIIYRSMHASNGQRRTALLYKKIDLPTSNRKNCLELWHAIAGVATWPSSIEDFTNDIIFRVNSKSGQSVKLSGFTRDDCSKIAKLLPGRDSSQDQAQSQLSTLTEENLHEFLDQ